jgi:hypothetical protein
MSSGSGPLTGDEAMNARLKYHMSVVLWTYQGAQNWARFNVMLVANSLLLLLIANVGTRWIDASWWIRAFSILGILLCALWSLLMYRGDQYHDKYIGSAKANEGLLPAQGSLGPAEGASTPPLGIRSRTVAYFVIGLFALVYFVLAWFPPHIAGSAVRS